MIYKFINLFKSHNKDNFILFDYRFTNIFNLYGVNLGDFIQSIAVKNVLLKIYPNINIVLHDRDSLAEYNGKAAFTIMQGWFSHRNKFIPNSNIKPVFIGTHITSEMQKYLSSFILENPDYFKNKVIGCRDQSTKEYFKKHNISSYLSRCLTLTFPKRIISQNQNKVFIVNVPEDLQSYIPQALLENSEIINQRFVDKGYKSSYYLKNLKKYFNLAEELLNRYRDDAKLVITTALHCAAPCIAMGIPVVLISEKNNDERFSTLEGIIKIYSIDDLKQRNIDYNIQVPNIEYLKNLMLKNVDLSIKQALDIPISMEYLSNIRQEIECYKIM